MKRNTKLLLVGLGALYLYSAISRRKVEMFPTSLEWNITKMPEIPDEYERMVTLTPNYSAYKFGLGVNYDPVLGF